MISELLQSRQAKVGYSQLSRSKDNTTFLRFISYQHTSRRTFFGHAKICKCPYLAYL